MPTRLGLPFPTTPQREAQHDWLESRCLPPPAGALHQPEEKVLIPRRAAAKLHLPVAVPARRDRSHPWRRAPTPPCPASRNRRATRDGIAVSLELLRQARSHIQG